MRVCVVDLKECWQDEAGKWMSSGGFPALMESMGSLFDDMTVVIEQSRRRGGQMPLPGHARVVALRQPVGKDTRRKISVMAHLPSYLLAITRAIREADVVHIRVPGDIPLL